MTTPDKLSVDNPLRPCPFCGGEAYYEGDHIYDTYVKICCGDCDATLDFGGNKITSTDKWNNRNE